MDMAIWCLILFVEGGFNEIEDKQKIALLKLC